MKFAIGYSIALLILSYFHNEFSEVLFTLVCLWTMAGIYGMGRNDGRAERRK
jgi:hypothetical protein